MGNPNRRATRRRAARESRVPMSPRSAVAADIAVGLLAAATGYLIALGPIGVTGAWAVGIAVLGGVCAILWRRWPHIAVLGMVVIGWSLAVPFATYMFSATTLGLGLDYQGRLAALALYGLLVGILSWRYSVGRAWVTAALAFLAVLSIASLAYAASWSWGLYPAYAAGLLVIALRAGGSGWIWDAIDYLGELRDRRRGVGVDLASWTDPRGAEVATAGLLGRLGDDYRVLHDRIIPGSKDDQVAIDHIVIGPTGVIVLGSLSCQGGKITTSAAGVLLHGRRPLDEALRHLAWQGSVVAHLSGLPTSSILVLQGTARWTIKAPVRVALLDHVGDEDETFLGEVAVVPGGLDDGAALRELITSGAQLHTASQIARYRRRICRALPARRVTAPSSWEVRDEIASLYPEQVSPVAVDDDGEVLDADRAPAAHLPEHREYEWGASPELDQVATEGMDAIAVCAIKPGDRVHALRAEGILTGWVVTSEPYLHADHAVPVLDIVDPDEYAEAQRSAREPRRMLAEPIANLTPAES